jgi:hypothetical protein
MINKKEPRKYITTDQNHEIELYKPQTTQKAVAIRSAKDVVDPASPGFYVQTPA